MPDTARDAAARKPRVLIVEDEFLIGLDISEQLKTAGFDVSGPAASVEEATQLIADEPIDVALLDINLGDTASYPVAEDLAKRQIPFVFVSGYVQLQVREDFRDRPVLAKPFAPGALLAAVHALTPAH